MSRNPLSVYDRARVAALGAQRRRHSFGSTFNNHSFAKLRGGVRKGAGRRSQPSKSNNCIVRNNCDARTESSDEQCDQESLVGFEQALSAGKIPSLKKTNYAH